MCLGDVCPWTAEQGDGVQQGWYKGTSYFLDLADWAEND